MAALDSYNSLDTYVASGEGEAICCIQLEARTRAIDLTSFGCSFVSVSAVDVRRNLAPLPSLDRVSALTPQIA